MQKRDVRGSPPRPALHALRQPTTWPEESLGPVSCAGQFGFRSAGQLAVWQFLLFVIDIGMLNPSTRDTVV